MITNYGSFFRQLRMNKNISISSLADEHISKGMISKFEREESDISVSRFFHLLEKIQVRPAEFDLTKNRYHPTGFEALLKEIQKYTLSENYGQLKKLANKEHVLWQQNKEIPNYLNYVMLLAIISENKKANVDTVHLNFLTDYLFKCENWGLYELILYTNSMSVLPIDTILAFSKSLPQKILLLKDSNTLLNTAINTIINTLILCIEHNKTEEGFFFIKVLDDFSMSEVMIFERMLFNVYKGVFFTKFTDEKEYGSQLIKDSLQILKLAHSDNLYDILLEDSNRLLFNI